MDSLMVYVLQLIEKSGPKTCITNLQVFVEEEDAFIAAGEANHIAGYGERYDYVAMVIPPVGESQAQGAVDWHPV